MLLRYCRLATAALLCIACLSPRAMADFEFKHNDHLAILGNGLPDRMQHDGWLEAFLQSANPGKNLVIRNMGFTGDEVAKRPREEGFPKPDEYLNWLEANVVFAFFGYNESYKHDPVGFKQELEKFIDETLAQKYDGKNTPRLVLFSPIAFENHNSPNLPDGIEQNLWLSIYTDAMARVAHDKGVPFVDLYTPSKALYEKSDVYLTINGIHLNAEGDKAIAQVISDALGQKSHDEHLESIRQAVQDKNWCWFNRYRATDGNDVWGNRSVLKFTDGQTNAEVLQNEMKMLDVMSDNRDKVIWEAIKGKEIAPDDSNVPKPLAVKTNLPNVGEEGPKYVPASEGVNTLKLEAGLKANLFASEEQFPEFVNPVQMDVDAKGRIWVATWEDYPKWQPNQPMLDRLLILPDDDHDGIADKAITFAFVHNPTGFTFWNGGVIVASVPNILFLKDTDGDDVADEKEILFSGLDSADTHHSPNGFDYGPDGYIYYQRGVFNTSNVETPWQGAQLSNRPGMYRFNPRTFRFSFHADNSPNCHGGDFDYWGYHFATDATSGNAFQVRPDKDGRFKMYKLLEKTVRPVPSSGILSSAHFPEKYDGNFLILNSIGFLGIKQYTLENKEGNFWGTETDELLSSSDPNFRPTDFKVGDDGALYVADWSNAIIGHMQHNIRDPSRDHSHGRMYRITCEGRPFQEHVEIAGQPIEKLLDVLKHPVNGVRLRARTELSGRDSEEVLAATTKWIQQFDPQKKEDAHPLLEALWLFQQHNVLNEGLLTLLLSSPDPDAKRAAERVKYMWEIEDKIHPDSMAGMHHEHMATETPPDDFMAQLHSPDPKMEGDTLVVNIVTLKELMKYDRREFAVAPGMKVKLTLTNPDGMDHNLIIVQPGAAPEVAMAAMMLGPDGIKKNWTPQSDKIIVGTKMVQMGKAETIEFIAPLKKGDYDYVCTYPGHYMLMNGVMHVVDDPAKWQAEHKNAPKDDGRKFIKEWTVADLAGDLDKLNSGRDIEKGNVAFHAAACITCHLPSAAGGRIGPDLNDVAKRLTPAAMLVEMIEPSKVINDKFKTYQISLNTGDGLTDDNIIGLVVEQNDDFVRVVTNPLQDTEGKKIARKDIKEMTPTPLSTMPTGMLNSFTRDEILDIMAYLRSSVEKK